MVPVPSYDPHLLEREVEALWKSRRLPPASGILGPPDGAVVHEFEGTFTPGDAPELVAQRAVAADVDARYLALVGRRAVSTLRWEAGPPEAADAAVGSLLRSLGVWVGGTGAAPWDVEPRHDRIEAMVGRLAHAGIVVARDFPMRCCPRCAAPRSPERIIYQEEEGDTFLVRFDLPWTGGVAHALVWVDAPWRLLGTTALLVHPELPYVVARYRRRDAEEVVFTSRSSLERFRTWLPEAQFEVLEERPGKEYAGRGYDYPLRHEFPLGGGLTPPAGTVLATSDVTDTGTGIVPLVPGHGGTDAVIAESHGVPGWPLITPRGQLDVTLVHKYAGLDLTTANEFIVRDLVDSAAVFAQLRVRRGVPHCAICGTPLLWMPGRAWCLEPGRLPADRLDLYRRLLPSAPGILRVEVAPWPISEAEQSEDPTGIALLECSRCEKLDALSGPPACGCGGTKFPTRRRLLPAMAGTLAAWARADPFPVEDSVRLYLPQRRRIPRLIHHLTGMAGVQGGTANSTVTVLSTIPEIDLAALVAANGADAVRAALVRSDRSDGGTASFAERCGQERRRLEQLWKWTQEILTRCEPTLLSSFARPISGYLRELEPEDRAVLARWDRAQALTLAAYDRYDVAAAHRRQFHYLENDLRQYLEWTRGRLALPGSAPSKLAALRTFAYVLRGTASLLAPVSPFLAESLSRRFTARTSLFESTVPAAERELRSEELLASWDRWRSVVAAVDAFRRDHRIPPGTVLPAVALVVPADDLGDKLRQDRSVLARLARVGRVDIGSPREAWPGRLRRLVPLEAEVQRVYGAQATQVVHLLQRLPPRRAGESAPAGELSVVIQGLPRQIPPSMVEYRDTLPDGTVPALWGLGEMYVELPAGGPRTTAGPPPLSPDAFWLMRRLARRLRATPSPSGGPLPIAIVATSDPLASELRAAADPLARFLGLAELRVVEAVEETRPPHRITGRTRTGAPWWASVPGTVGTPRRAKHRRPRASRRRVPTEASATEGLAHEVDFADPALVAKEESIRELNEELDALLGVPLVGPTKVRAAWDLGLQSVDAFRHAPFETVAALPGFGHTLASTLTVRLGGSAPPTGPRPHRRAPESPSPSTAGVPRPARETMSLPPEAPTAEPPSIPTIEHPEPDELSLPEKAPVRTPSEPTARAEEPSSPEVPAPPTTPDEAPLPGLTELPEDPSAAPPAPPELPPPAEPGTPEPQSEVPTAEPRAPAANELTGPEPLPDSPSDESRPTEAIREEPELSPESVVTLPVPEAPLPEMPAPEEGAPTPRETQAEEGVAPSEPAPEAMATAPSEPVPEPPAIEAPTGPPASEAIEPGPEVSEPQRPSAPEPELPTSESEPVRPEETLEEPPAPANAEASTPSPEPPVETVSEPTPTEPSTPSPELSVETVAEPAPTEPSTPAPGSSGDTVAEPSPTVPPVEENPTPESSISEPPAPALETVSESPPAEPSGAETVEAPAPPETPEEPRGEAFPPAPAPPEGGPDEVSVPLEATLPEPVPVAPPSPAPEPEPETPRGGVELEVSGSSVASLQPFLEAAAAGLKGVCIVRESPERIAAHIGGRPVDIYWLSNLGRGRTLKPNDLHGIAAFLTRELDEENVTIFFLEGIEYLVRIHGLEATLGCLVEFGKKAQEREARVWVHVTPDLVKASDLERIVAAFPRPPGAA